MLEHSKRKRNDRDKWNFNPWTANSRRMTETIFNDSNDVRRLEEKMIEKKLLVEENSGQKWNFNPRTVNSWVEWPSEI